MFDGLSKDHHLGYSDGTIEWWLQSHRDGMPGGRDALPPGTLPGIPCDPQADENREPPPNAPTIPR